MVEKNNIPFGTAQVFSEPIVGRELYDFEDTPVGGEVFPEDLLVNKRSNIAEIVNVGGDNMLRLVGTDFYYYDSPALGETNWNTKKQNPTVTVFAYPKDVYGNAYVLSYDINVDSAYIQSPVGSTIFKMAFCDTLDRVFMNFTLRYESVDGATYIKLFDAARRNTELLYFAAGERVNLRLEYFPELGKTKVYLGENYVAESANGAVSLPRKLVMSIETGANTEIFLDNVSFTKSLLEYGAQAPVPVEPPPKPEQPELPESKPIYDFEDIESTDALTAGLVLYKRYGAAEIVDVGGNKKLRLVGTDNYYHDSPTPGEVNWNTKKFNPYFSTFSYSESAGGDVFVYSLDLSVEYTYIESHSGTRIINISFRDATDNVQKMFLLNYHTGTDGKKRIQLVDNANPSAVLADFATGEETRLKFVVTLGKTVEVYQGEVLSASLPYDSIATISRAMFYMETGANTALTVDNVSFIRESADGSSTYGSTGEYDFDSATFVGGLPDGVSVSDIRGTCAAAGAAVSVAERGGNKYLRVCARDGCYNYSTGYVDWELVGKNPTLTFAAGGSGEDGYFTVDMDVRFDVARSYSSGGSKLAAMRFFNGDVSIFDNSSSKVANGITMIFYKDGETLAIQDNMTSVGYTQFNVGEDIHLSFEYRDGRMYYFGNDTRLGSWPVCSSEITHIEVAFYDGAHADVEIDNVRVFNN